MGDGVVLKRFDQFKAQHNPGWSVDRVSIKRKRRTGFYQVVVEADGKKYEGEGANELEALHLINHFGTRHQFLKGKQ